LISIIAHAISAGASNGVFGQSVKIAVTGDDDTGSAAIPLQLWADTFSFTSGGGDAYLLAQGNPSIGVSGTGIDLDGGALTLLTGGNLTQTAAIVVGALDIDYGHGSVALTNSGNNFATLALTSSGTNGSTIYDGTALSLSASNIGGTLSLTTPGAITQSGAITAGGLDLTSTGGAITLANTGNAFDALTLSTSGSNDATVYNASDLVIGGADVGGTFKLTGAGTITQSGAIAAAKLDVTSSGGAITLDNTGNMFDALALATSGSNNATIYDGSDLAIAGADVGGTFALTSTGNITQSGAIWAGALDLTAGTITLTNSGNGFATLTLATSGSNDATIYDGTGLDVAGANGGGKLTLVSTGPITQTGAITVARLNVSGSEITLGDTGNLFSTLTLATSGANDATIYDGSALGIGGATVGGTLTLTSTGAITQTGAITVNGLNLSGGAITLSDTGNTFHTLTLATSGSNDATIYDSAALAVAGANVGGGLALTSAGGITQTGAIAAKALDVTAGGDIVLDALDNSFASLVLDAGSHAATVYDASDLAANGIVANGGLTLLSTGNLTFNSSAQIGSGALLAVAGWDGTTTNASALTAGSTFGNSHGTILIGGADASGGVAVGATGGATLAGYDIVLSAENGYAQFGLHGGGSGALSAIAKNDVTLAAGSSSGFFAQIGHGGDSTSGSGSGDIAVSAGGDVDLVGGAGSDAYAQIGHGGAKANANSSGYSETGIVTVTAANANLTGGSGTGAYAQLGHGGYFIGAGLTGTATMTGDVTLTVSHSVNVNGGAGEEAFAQIGNGGDQANANAGSGAGGTTSGKITVAAPQGVAGGVNLLAGAGLDAYAQIGNGGYAINAGAVPASFTIGGDISITDLLLVGGNGGANAYAQVGNGDAGHASSANVSGDIAIETGGGTITVTPGAAANSGSMIGNATGKGTVSGTITGYTPPSQPSDVTNNVVAVLTDTKKTTIDNFTDTTNLITIDTGTDIAATVGTSTETGSTPIEDLMGGDGGETGTKTDSAANSLGNSLDGSKKKAQTEVFIGGLLKRRSILPPSSRPHGVPPADGDYSSWGNEAFWE
jgi:hypothetical protein